MKQNTTKMKKAFISLLLFNVLSLNFYSQDSIICYDLKSKNITIILPTSINTSISSDNTLHAVGSLGNQIPLSLTPPTTNLFNGSNFSDIARAVTFYNLSDYPIRTGIKLFRYQNDSLKNCCSGLMVGENIALTSAHCVRSISSNVWIADSFLVAPSYDNGLFHPNLPVSKVSKIYIYKPIYDTKFNATIDIALIQLEQPIGKQIGWQGIAYNDNPSFFSSNVFHKLSYPSIVSPFDPTKIYNGDTMYYNYGNIFTTSANAMLSIPTSNALGIPGQSGSSFFYTDNSNNYYSFGVMVYSLAYQHCRITNQIFNDFKNIMNNYTSVAENNFSNPYNVQLYPNPFHEKAILKFDNPFNLPHNFSIINALGASVLMIDDITGNEINITNNNISPGIYFYQLSNSDKILHTGKIIIQ